MQKHKHTKEKKQKFFPADQLATEVASCIVRDLSRPILFDQGRDISLLEQLRSRQIIGTLKRYQSFDGYDRSSLELEAFDTFHGVNQHMAKTNHRILNRDPEVYSRCWTASDKKSVFTIDNIIVTSQFLLKQVLWYFDTDEFHSMCKHGNGSTIGASYEDTSADKKFTYPMSCTEGAKRLFSIHRKCNHRLHLAIENLNSHIAFSEEVEVVNASRGTTVDKTSSKRRMIAVEPTLNMFLQQGLMGMMYARLKDAGLDLRSLPARHRALAKRGSIDRSLGTIDFSHASDSVSYELVRLLFPADWFEYLNMVRTPEMEILGVSYPLNMFSTMGNATTFPIETLIFWSLACACHHHFGAKSKSNLVNLRTRRECSVFGDDCIIPTSTCPIFIEVCVLLGFIVNVDKSFVDPDESFRESCGGDYYQGYDVKPYSFKAPRNMRVSSLEPWLYTILNNILPIYTKYFGYCSSVLTGSLFELYLRLFDVYDLKFRCVPFDFPDDAGIRCNLLSRDNRPELTTVLTLIVAFGGSYTPIYKTDSHLYDFSYVNFRYPKDKDRCDYIKYALQCYFFTADHTDEEEIYHVFKKGIELNDKILGRSLWFLSKETEEDFSFSFGKTPIRKKGGYVVSRTTGRFY